MTTGRSRQKFGLWRLYLLRLELKLAPSEAQRLFLLTIGIGAACGLAAVAFHLAIDLAEASLIESALHAPRRYWIAWTIATPALGGLLCGILLERFFPRARGSGIPQVKQVFACARPVLSLRDSIGKFVVGSLQLGTGASLGREGPTVQICAGIASSLGRWAAVSPRTERRLIPVGVAAGIAAAFNAPIAAVTFTIEEIVGTLDQAVLSGVIVAAAVAAVIARSLLGEHPVFDVPGSYGLHHASSLVLYAFIGIASGLVSVIFTESILGLRSRFRRLTLLPRWAHPALGGMATGMLAVTAVLFLRSGGITGGGYATLGEMLNGLFSWWVLLALCGLKLAATVFSYSSGGAGGIFAPTLFIGGALGGAVGAIDTTWLGHRDDPGAFALVGMGALFAGVVRAPITSVLIIIEMTRGYSLILPLMIANTIAYALARRFRQQSIYEALLEQDGVTLGQPSESAEPPRVVSLVGTAQAIVLSPGMSAEEIFLRCSSAEAGRVFPVVNDERQVLGVVTREEVARLAESPDRQPGVTAFDLMREPVTVSVDDALSQAIHSMLTHSLRELPVTDDQGRLIGSIDDTTVAKAWSVANLARLECETPFEPGLPPRNPGAADGGRSC